MNSLYEILIISLWCVGVYLLFKKDMGLLFSFVDEWHDRMVLERRDSYVQSVIFKKYIRQVEDKYMNKYNWIVNPLWACLFCMSSFHTLLLKTLLHWEDITLLWYVNNFVDIVITMVCVVGLNSIIYSQIKNIIK